MKRIGMVLCCVLLLSACTAAPESAVSSVPFPAPPQSTVPSSSVAASLPIVVPPLPKVNLEKFTKEIDFEALQATNEDVAAWLQVPNTNIDTPVMVGIDNAFYLTHNAAGQDFAGGCPFMDMANTRGFGDALNVVYGHLMPDDTIFTQLHLYEDAGFFSDNRDVLVYLPGGGKMEYQIIAAFYTDDRNVLYQRDFWDYETRQYLINWMSGAREPAGNVNMDGVAITDRFIMLSTCAEMSTAPNLRYVVIAHLVGESL